MPAKVRLTRPGQRLWSARAYAWLLVGVLVSAFTVSLLEHYTINAVSTNTATLVPDGDVTTGWPSVVGSNDGSCSGGTHCSYVDDGTVSDTGNYISTSGSTAGGEVEEYTLSSVPNIQSASKIELKFYFNNGAIGGGAPDLVTYGLRINGTLQTTNQCGPTQAWVVCFATYTGSWTQSDVDSMQVYIQRSVQGSGNPSSRADTIELANVYGTLTYTPSLTVTQSAYRWFDNQDAAKAATFATTYGGVGYEDLYAMAPTNDGGYVATGTTASGSSGYEMFISKYTASGVLSWSKTWGSYGYEQGAAVTQMADGSYVVVGYTNSIAMGNDMLLIAKFTSDGTIVSTEVQGDTGGNGMMRGQAVTKTADGGFASTGYTTIPSVGTNTDAVTYRYNSDGSLAWGVVWGGSGNDQGDSVIQTTDGGFAVTGSTGSYGAGGDDMFIAKYTSNGTLAWNKTWGGSGDDQGNSIAQTTDGGFVVTGSTGSYGAGGKDMFVAKYTASGVLSWSKAWGGSGDDQGNSIVQAADGGFAVTGSTGSYGAGGDDMFIAKYTSNGTLAWNKTWGGIYDDFGRSIEQVPDGGYAVAGYGSSYSVNLTDGFLVKYTGTGELSGCGSICSSPTVATSSVTASESSPITGGTSRLSPVAATGGTGLPTFYMDSVVSLDPISIQVGSPLATQDAAATVQAGSGITRLRLDLHMEGSQVAAGQLALKLRYAVKPAATTCSEVASTNFNDVTDSSAISYADNLLAGSGLAPASDVNDPVHGSDTNVSESYQEKGTVTFDNPQAIPDGQDGLWDFALSTSGATPGASYCFRVVKSDNSPLDSYAVVPELTVSAGELSAKIVDSSGNPVASPGFAMALVSSKSTCQSTSGTFGTSNQRLRVTNNLVTSGWGVSMAATDGPSAAWLDSDSGYKYDFNDQTGSPAGCGSGLDGDDLAGGLWVAPSQATITSKAGCTTNGVSLGADSGFSEGSSDAITLMTASSSADFGCYWDMTGVHLAQSIPGGQPPGSYTIDMMITVVAQ